MADFPKLLPEKLKEIRKATKLDPDDFARQVNAKDGAEIIAYENGGDMSAEMLLAYAKFANVPLENLTDDDCDLWWAHR